MCAKRTFLCNYFWQCTQYSYSAITSYFDCMVHFYWGCKIRAQACKGIRGHILVEHDLAIHFSQIVHLTGHSSLVVTFYDLLFGSGLFSS